jgi:hypothetical protein
MKLNCLLGSTSVLHDSELEMDVGHCADPGCYSRAISYQATKRQMLALSELSNECHQSIKVINFHSDFKTEYFLQITNCFIILTSQYNCTTAPFEMNGVAYAWWNDRNGDPQYFWSGSNSSVHICQCGIDHNCVESFMPCNCDSSLPAALSDSGIIL